MCLGKLAQRTNMTKTSNCTEEAHLTSLLCDSTKNITDFHLINDNVCMVEYSTKEDHVEADLDTNCIVASFVTGL